MESIPLEKSLFTVAFVDTLPRNFNTFAELMMSRYIHEDLYVHARSDVIFSL